MTAFVFLSLGDGRNEFFSKSAPKNFEKTVNLHKKIHCRFFWRFFRGESEADVDWVIKQSSSIRNKAPPTFSRVYPQKINCLNITDTLK